jgi:ABC-type lipoprotein export system ATPase subunit
VAVSGLREDRASSNAAKTDRGPVTVFAVRRVRRRKSTAPPRPAQTVTVLEPEPVAESRGGAAVDVIDVISETEVVEAAEVAEVAVPTDSEDIIVEIDDTVPVAVPQRDWPSLEGFRDLLGQAVGLRLDGVTRTYRIGDVRVNAVHDVSLEIAPGEFVAVVGPSGSGKTTLLGMLGGLDRPTEGHVYAAGAALDQLPEPDLADYRLQRVGTIFQSFNLVPTLSAEDNVGLPLLLAGVSKPERHLRARRLLQLVGLEERARFRPSRLSGGDQQRVAVARALASRPGLVLADEPTGNLDSATGEQVLRLLDDLHQRGATIVLVTHDQEVARRADRVVKMRDGRIVANKTMGRRTSRAPLPLDRPTRLAARDALRMGVDAVGRRPLRSILTAAGTALGMGLTSLILSLSSTTDLGRGVTFLAALTLLVAGFGIVNTMYTSVLDRTREIGVLKALGARFEDITLIFIAESGLIGAVSGLAGAALAGELATLGNRVAGGPDFHVTAQIGVMAVLLALGLSLLAGLLPAVRAARQDPMRALRYE